VRWPKGGCNSPRIAHCGVDQPSTQSAFLLALCLKSGDPGLIWTHPKTIPEPRSELNPLTGNPPSNPTFTEQPPNEQEDSRNLNSLHLSKDRTDLNLLQQLRPISKKEASPHTLVCLLSHHWEGSAGHVKCWRRDPTCIQEDAHARICAPSIFWCEVIFITSSLNFRV
jgi:hypothetical protein